MVLMVEVEVEHLLQGEGVLRVVDLPDEVEHLAHVEGVGHGVVPVRVPRLSGGGAGAGAGAGACAGACAGAAV